MKLGRISVLIGAATAALSIAAFPSSAHALDFNWTFSGDSSAPGTVSGTVTGLVEGSNAGGSGEVVTVTSSPGWVALGTYVFEGTLAGGDAFTVTGGNLTYADFAGSLGLSGLFLESNAGSTVIPQFPQFQGYDPFFGSYNISNMNSGASVSFTPSTPSSPVPFEIPGGATIPALGSILALAAMRSLRKSVASNTNPISATVSAG